MTAAPARKRRSQAERRADTRSKVLDAAIRCLHERGYAATTSTLVAEEAGLSRGAIQNQFPTKVDLMLFVVREVYEQELLAYNELLGGARREELSAWPEIAWEVLSRPAAIAVLEIMLGSRSDPELAARLGPLQREIEADSFEQVARIANANGQRVSPAAIRLVVWAARGLSIAQILTGDREGAGKSMRLLRHLLEASSTSSN